MHGTNDSEQNYQNKQNINNAQQCLLFTWNSETRHMYIVWAKAIAIAIK